jgi:hypothetical protein
MQAVEDLSIAAPGYAAGMSDEYSGGAANAVGKASGTTDPGIFSRSAFDAMNAISEGLRDEAELLEIIGDALGSLAGTVGVSLAAERQIEKIRTALTNAAGRIVKGIERIEDQAATLGRVI